MSYNEYTFILVLGVDADGLLLTGKLGQWTEQA
jgi:hypothetical protein